MCNQTLDAAIAPPTGRASVVGRTAANAAEMARGERRGRGQRRKVVRLGLVSQVLFLEERREVFPKSQLEVIASRLPLLLLRLLRFTEGWKAGVWTWRGERAQRVVLEVVFLQSLELPTKPPQACGVVQNSPLAGLHPSRVLLLQHHVVSLLADVVSTAYGMTSGVAGLTYEKSRPDGAVSRGLRLRVSRQSEEEYLGQYLDNF